MPLRTTAKGNALRFDGVDDKVEIPSDPSLKITDVFTIMVWVYPVEIVYGTLYHQSFYNPGQFLALRVDGRIRLLAQNTDHVDVLDFEVESYSLKEWQFFCATFDGEVGIIYKNGVEIGSQDALVENRVLHTDDKSEFVGCYQGTTNYVHGMIDEVRVYNRALSAKEVEEAFNDVFRDNTGLVLHLPFSEGRSLRTLDLSGDNNHGTIHGAEWVNKVTGGLRFDGVDDRVEIPHSSSLNLTEAVTVEAWIHLAKSGKSGGVFEKSIGEVVNKQYLLLIENGLPRFRVIKSAASYDAGSDIALPVGRWFHYVGVFDGSEVRCYVDTVLQTTHPEVSAPIDSGVGKSFVGMLAGSIFPMDGIIDKVRVYNRALSAEEILARFKGEEIDRTGLVLDLPFSECEGTVAKDGSGYGNDGSIIGAEWVVKRNTRLSAASRALAVTR